VSVVVQREHDSRFDSIRNGEVMDLAWVVIPSAVRAVERSVVGGLLELAIVCLGRHGRDDGRQPALPLAARTEHRFGTGRRHIHDGCTQSAKIDQPRSGSVPAGAGYVSVQRLPSLTSGERKHRPLVFTMASTVARLEAILLLADSSGRSALAGRCSHFGGVHGPLLHPARPGRG
jgi:hypothetical protein